MSRGSGQVFSVFEADLRDPLSIAKQATSLDHQTGNRFLLGLSTGDRPFEYPAFGTPFDNRAERFRDAHAIPAT